MIRQFGVVRWTDEDEATLERLVKEGLPASAIGRAMDRTRNSIIGRVGRIGLKLVRQPNSTPEQREAIRVERLLRKKEPRVPKPTVREPQALTMAAEAVPNPVVRFMPTMPPASTKPVTLFALRPSSCRFPLWSNTERPRVDKAFYCGEVVYGAGPYCLCHAERCNTALPPRKGPHYVAARNQSP